MRAVNVPAALWSLDGTHHAPQISILHPGIIEQSFPLRERTVDAVVAEDDFIKLVMRQESLEPEFPAAKVIAFVWPGYKIINKVRGDWW